MYRHGHSDPTFTMRVYQQVLDMGGPATGVLERVLGSTVEEAFAAWSGRGVSGLKPDSAENPQKRAGRASAPSAKKLRKCRAFLRAADGIRTHDLLHGKQKVGEGSSHKLPANALLHAGVRHAGCLGFHADCRTFED
jgi:hypothetical protein